MLFKVQRGRQNVKLEVASGAYATFLQSIEKSLSCQEHEFDVLIGYPPKLVKCENREQPIEQLGFKSGELVTIRDNAKKKALYDGVTALGIPKSIFTKALACLDPESADLDLFAECCIQLAASEDGDGAASRQKIARRVIDADNSCLFNAIGYLMLGGEAAFKTFDPLSYRRIVADAVLGDPESYGAEMLEKEPAEYAQWIMKPDKWGGEIELFVLAKHLGVEIVAVDIRTGNCLTYGHAGVGADASQQVPAGANRIYVIYDGVHYDAVRREKGILPSAREVTKFDSRDEQTFAEVRQLAKTLREQKQFVNLSTGSLQCKVCFKVLDGETAAVEHAKSTGHQNFGQV
jgi:hypothetical protein